MERPLCPLLKTETCLNSIKTWKTQNFFLLFTGETDISMLDPWDTD